MTRINLQYKIIKIMLKSTLIHKCHSKVKNPTAQPITFYFTFKNWPYLNTIQYNTMKNLHSKTDKHTVSLI